MDALPVCGGGGECWGGVSGGCDLKIPKCFMLLSFPGAGSGGAPGGERA